MFSKSNTAGKHMICDFKNIINTELLNNKDSLQEICRNICYHNHYDILGETEKVFEPHGFTFLFLLGESHLSLHTFPERNYIAFDLYTCREYTNDNVYHNIFIYLKNILDAETSEIKIIDRCF